MNQKQLRIIGVFLALIMVTSVMLILFEGLGNDSNRGTTMPDQAEAPGFEIIDGNHFMADINSIADGLKFTPEGVTSVAYIDYSLLYGPQIEEHPIYNTVITKRYSANNEDFAFEAHVLSPEVINFGYMEAGTYNGYSFLSRGEGLYNVIGTPTLLGERSDLETVIDVFSGMEETSTDFSDLLVYVQDGADYQMLTSEDTFTDKRYQEIRYIGDGNYSRTDIFINPLDDVIETINIREETSIERGLIYDINIEDDGRILKVVITADQMYFSDLLSEELW